MRGFPFKDYRDMMRDWVHPHSMSDTLLPEGLALGKITLGADTSRAGL